MRGHVTSRSRDYSVASTLHDKFTQSLRKLCHIEAQRLSGSPEGFRWAYLGEQLLSKFDDGSPETAAERKSAAISKWQLMELRNARTNVRFFCGVLPTNFIGRNEEVLSSERILSKAKEIVASVLGEAPDLEVLYGTFSDGASTGFTRGEVAAKFRMGADVTGPCLARFQSILESCETWKMYRGPLVPNIVVGGSLFTVPKNSEIDRCAIKEPELNMWCQKGIGNFIREAVRRKLRLNLNDQTRNQILAQKGSIDGSTATLDLSSASDLISIEFVRLMLPSAWFDLLDDCRSQAVVVDGKVQTLNMFSSMGNGFTWELQSLLFAALTHAVTWSTGSRGQISVYGDDIICPSSVAGLLVKVLQYCGFKVNSKKSYWTGRFRESCGKHWYAGLDVSPFYIRQRIKVLPDLILRLNQLRGWAVMPTLPDTCNPNVYPVWKRYSRYVPTAYYGGRDLERKDSLVTPHQPRMLLVKQRKPVTPDPLGAYLQWLRSTDGRRSPVGIQSDYSVLDPTVTSTVQMETETLKVRRSNVLGTIRIPTFSQEWDDEGS